MNDQKDSKLFLWLGIIIGVSSTIFLILYQLTKNNKYSISSRIDKYINISYDQKSTGEEEISTVQIRSAIVKDNLKEIKGIGPAIESLLNENGILTFSDLGASRIDDLKIILDKKNLRLADPETWPNQAQQAAKKHK